jgi:DNA-binding NtrC family response regulator
MPQPATVLVVDDQLGPRESLRVILQRDYHVLVATDGEQAVRLAAREPVDVVLLDLRLPGFSGLQVLEQLKARNPTIVVIIITGSELEGMVPAELRMLIFECIVKPFQVAHVRETVKRAVAHRAR